MLRCLEEETKIAWCITEWPGLPIKRSSQSLFYRRKSILQPPQGPNSLPRCEGQGASFGRELVRDHLPVNEEADNRN